MLVQFQIEEDFPVCAPYDDCIDVILAARANGKNVTVVEISLDHYETYIHVLKQNRHD